MPPREISKLHASVCQVFANPYRIEIIEALVKKECTTDELAKMMDTTAANISQHIKLMRDRGVVLSERRGQWIYHRLLNDDLKKLFLYEREILADLFRRAAEIFDMYEEAEKASS